MSATLAPPPPPVVAPPPARGGRRRAARSAAGHGGCCAASGASRYWLSALLTVAVAATTVGLGLVVNVQGTDQGVFGTADARIDIANPGPNGVAADVAAARQRFGTVEAIAHGRRAGAGVDHAGGSARPGPARGIQQADAASGLRPLPGRAPARRR